MCNLSSMKGGDFGKHNGHPHPTDRILHRMHVGCKQDAGIRFLEMPVFKKKIRDTQWVSRGKNNNSNRSLRSVKPLTASLARFGLTLGSPLHGPLFQ